MKLIRATLAAMVALTPLLAAQAPQPALSAPRPQGRPFELADMDRLVGLSDPQIAPDGRGVAVFVSRTNAKENRQDRELVWVDSGSGSLRVLVKGRKGLAHARWSPTGDRLGFLAEAEGKSQVFVLPMAGGEAQQASHSATGVQHFSWSPDGTRIAYGAEDEAPKISDAQKGEDGFEVGNDDLFTGEAARPVHIWVMNADGGDAKRLTQGSWTLPVSLPPSPPASPLSWSPDGKRLAFVRQETPHTGDQDQAAVQVLDLASGAIRPLTGQKMFEGFPNFSPDGRLIAYWWTRKGDPQNINEIHVAPADGGPGRDLTEALDRCLYRSIWMPGGKGLLVGGNDGTRVKLWVQPLQGPARALDLGEVSPSWSYWIDVSVATTGAIAFTGRTARHSAELFVLDSSESKPRRLTNLNGFLDDLNLGKVERVAWKGPGGWAEDGVLTYPPNAVPGQQLPLALVIHGGPNAASTEMFNNLNQLLAAQGFLVFNPNYRGSDNLGNAYYRSITMDWGEGPGQDVMAGIEALKARGLVDANRMVVSGWSYGGYMTSWLLGRYPETWKAGMAGAAVTDFVDEYACSDGNQTWKYGMLGALPFDGGKGQALYWAQSPISLAHRIQAPTLILSMNQDARVPPTQSYKLYRALKDRGVPVKFFAWPQAGHGAGTPARQRQVARLWVEWLAQHAR